MGIATCVAHNDHAVVQITRGINGGGHADVDCSAGNNQSIDAPRAKRQVKISLMKSAPTVFGNDVIFGPWCDFLDDFLLPRAVSGAVHAWIAVVVRPGAKTHIGVGNHQVSTL